MQDQAPSQFEEGHCQEQGEDKKTVIQIKTQLVSVRLVTYPLLKTERETSDHQAMQVIGSGTDSELVLSLFGAYTDLGKNLGLAEGCRHSQVTQTASQNR